MVKDKYHDIVKEALIAEGWTITDDPLYIPTLKRTLRVDLGAERVIGAEKDNQRIAIEIKSFVGFSDIHEFYKALGQFNYYQLAFEDIEPERMLYLAVPVDIFDSFFSEPLTLKAIQRYDMRVIVYQINQAKIEKWIK
jgi:hypothetical protein